MNVLILTPDAVGSTLLQRLLTIYMQFHTFDQPTINLHELTNGLAKYYSPEFNREIVSKKAVKNWGYYQTLQEVVEILSSVDHYKTSRLAHYHIRQRGDSIDQQIPFYNYLNENFYIIACRRNNIFEHAISMTLNKVTKKLNVYDAYEKINTFYEIYKSGITLDPTVFVKQLDAYKLYINWSEQYFDVSSYFNYEQDVPRIEQYILNLPIFSNQSNLVSWEHNFGISFNDWNKMQYARSDLNNVPITYQNEVEMLIPKNTNLLEDYQQHAYEHWPAVFSSSDISNLPQEIKQQWTQDIIRRDGIIPLLDNNKQKILSQFKHNFEEAQKTIDQMVSLGIIVGGPPIKKQTLGEKRRIIKNFDALVDLYNEWLIKNPNIASPITDYGISKQSTTESSFWNSIFTQGESQLSLPPTQK